MYAMTTRELLCENIETFEPYKFRYGFAKQAKKHWFSAVHFGKDTWAEEIEANGKLEGYRDSLSIRIDNRPLDIVRQIFSSSPIQHWETVILHSCNVTPEFLKNLKANNLALEECRFYGEGNIEFNPTLKKLHLKKGTYPHSFIVPKTLELLMIEEFFAKSIEYSLDDENEIRGNLEVYLHSSKMTKGRMPFVNINVDGIRILTSFNVEHDQIAHTTAINVCTIDQLYCCGSNGPLPYQIISKLKKSAKFSCWLDPEYAHEALLHPGLKLLGLWEFPAKGMNFETLASSLECNKTLRHLEFFAIDDNCAKIFAVLGKHILKIPTLSSIAFSIDARITKDQLTDISNHMVTCENGYQISISKNSLYNGLDIFGMSEAYITKLKYIDYLETVCLSESPSSQFRVLTLYLALISSDLENEDYWLPNELFCMLSEAIMVVLIGDSTYDN